MTFLARACAFVLPLSSLQAGEGSPIDPDLPQPIDYFFAEGLVTNSPFTRAVNLQASLQLTGVAYVDGHPIATVLNKDTQQRFVISEEPNALGWQLINATAGSDLNQTQVEVRIGEELIAMHYQGQQLSPGGGPYESKARLAGSDKKEGGKSRTSSLLGEHGKKMYSSLSPEARDKFKELIRARTEQHPELTPEQNADYAQKIFAKIKASDSSAKSPKPPKKKQGA
ncbi:MAG: hypothetical protein R3F13_08995 [Prosthecobacter sp.]